MSVKKVLFLGDLHCGSYWGMTPESHRISRSLSPKLHNLQTEMLSQFDEWSNAFGKPDVVVVNGDTVNGKNKLDGGNGGETDLFKQRDMAVNLLKRMKPKKLLMTRGTSFHVAIEGQCIEDLVAEKMGCQIENLLLLEIEGVVCDIRHFCGRSSTANGQFAPVSRERILQALEAERDRNPAKVYIRSHVHRHCYCGEGSLKEPSGWVAMTLPALQARGVPYGQLKCSGRTDFGMVWGFFDKGDVSWKVFAERLEGEKRETIKC